MEISVKLNDYRIKTSASSFFQSNIPLFEKAVTSIKSYSRGETLLDLYAGAAVFGTLMSDSFSRIISVEEDSLALQYGKKNIPDRSGLKKDFYPVSVERFIKKDRMRIKPDTVIADPPRTGLSKQGKKISEKHQAGSPYLSFMRLHYYGTRYGRSYRKKAIILI